MQIQTEEMRRAMGEADMARYSLKAYENCDEKNPLQAMLCTPKPVGMEIFNLPH